MTNEQSQQPTPELLFDTAMAQQRTAALKGAVDLGLFTAIAELDPERKSAATAADIAARCGASVRGTRVLCDYLTIIGFLTKQGQTYGLTLDSAVFLNRHSPAYMGSVMDFLCSPHLQARIQDVAAVVRKGGTTVEDEDTLHHEHPLWITFARAMAPMMAMPAQTIARTLQSDGGHKIDPNQPLKVLDIAAGHGLFGIALAQHFPQAQVYALDWPHVLEVASENARAAGVAERHHLLPGSAFDVDFGSGYDIVLLTNFLHHFDPPTNETLLRKVHAALAAGGRAVTVEFVPNEDRITPPQAAGFSLTMLISTPSGDAYTYPELERMFRNAGFARSEIHQVPPMSQPIILSYK